MADKVRGAKAMDDDTFVKHLNARHLGDIGLTSIKPGGEMGYMRAFHKRIHEHGQGSLPHEHTGENR
jgi:hypothetical protein